MAGVVSDIEVLQVRHGDKILLRPKNNMTDAEIHALCDQLRAWLDYRRMRVDVSIMPTDVDIIVIRECRT